MMVKPEPQRATLGYHEMGAYFYFSVLGEGNRFLGAGGEEKFHDVQSFAGLVTGVHEHYHLMQELTQGYFWWRQNTRDRLVASISQAIRNSPDKTISFPLWSKPEQPPPFLEINLDDPISVAQLLVFEQDTMHRYWRSPQVTQSLLTNEMRDSPQLARFVNEDVLNLTTIDLVECQAAILTELYLSKLLVERPDQFDAEIAVDMAELFRVDRMDDAYLRPLRALVYIMDTMGVKLQMDDAHPMYSQIKHGSLYILLVFLLDYALHIPPNPLGLFAETPDTACLQDIYPPFRFINLVFLTAFEIAVNRKGFNKVLTNETLYYSEGSPALADLINEMHDTVRRQNPDTPNPPKTFFDMDETTQKWIDSSQNAINESHFPLMHTLWSQCLQFRRKQSSFFLELSPLDFDMMVGVPRVFITSRGLGTLPYFVAETELDDEQRNEFLSQAMKVHFEGFSSESVDHDALAQFPATLVPLRFIEEWTAREMSFRFSTAILYGEPLRCPLTESIGLYVPCRSRRPSCELISIPADAPAHDCLMRATIERVFGNTEQFNRKETK